MSVIIVGFVTEISVVVIDVVKVGIGVGIVREVVGQGIGGGIGVKAVFVAGVIVIDG